MSDERLLAPDEITIPSASKRTPVEPLGLASVGQVRSRSAALSSRDFALVGCAIAFIAVIVLLYLLQSAEVTSLAYSVSDRRAEVERLNEENSVLESEILTLTQLDRIEARAAALGMGSPDQSLYLTLGDAAPAATPGAEAGQ